MGILACGFNHHETAIAEREQWALTPESWPALLAEAKSNHLKEAVIVSTCNRTELYAVAESREVVERCFSQLYQGTIDCLPSRLYWHESTAAVQHLMRVSSGLDSMCVGEPQILGQVKLAYQTACTAGTVGPHFRALFPAVFSVSKLVRTETDLGTGAVTLAYAVCQLVRQLYKTQKKRRVLCIGAGETIQSMLSHLSNQESLSIQIANRSLAKAEIFANRYNIGCTSWDQLPAALAQADIVITATASEEPILSVEAVTQACQNRQSDEPLFMADLAVPRDIDSRVADLAGVLLYNLDDMRQVLQKNQRHRSAAAQKAENIITQETQRFIIKNKIAASADLIKTLRVDSEELRDHCLSRALAQLHAGSDPELVLRRLANDLTNKILHQPTLSLRDAIANGDEELGSEGKQGTCTSC